MHSSEKASACLTFHSWLSPQLTLRWATGKTLMVKDPSPHTLFLEHLWNSDIRPAWESKIPSLHLGFPMVCDMEALLQSFYSRELLGAKPMSLSCSDSMCPSNHDHLCLVSWGEPSEIDVWHQSLNFLTDLTMSVLFSMSQEFICTQIEEQKLLDPIKLSHRLEEAGSSKRSE